MLLLGIASAAPVDSVQALSERATPSSSTKPDPPLAPAGKKPAPPAPTYPTDAELTAACNPTADKTLFFSGVGGQQKPTAYKNQAGLQMVKDTYPKNFLKNKASVKTETYDAFVERFSRVFAQKAAGTVHVMLPWTGSPDSKRVWASVEEPALKANSAVKEIIQVDPDNFSQTKPYWTRS